MYHTTYYFDVLHFQIVEDITTIIKNNSRQCDTQELILLATLFSAYPLSPELSPLLETILEQLSQYPLNEDIRTLYHSLTVSQKNVYSSKGKHLKPAAD